MLRMLRFAEYRRGTGVDAVKSLAEYMGHIKAPMEIQNSHIAMECGATARGCAFEKVHAVVKARAVMRVSADKVGYHGQHETSCMQVSHPQNSLLLNSSARVSFQLLSPLLR